MIYRAPLAFAAALLLAGCGGGASSTATTATTSKAPAVSPATKETSAPSPVPGFSNKQEASERLEAIKKQIEKRYKILKTKPVEK